MITGIQLMTKVIDNKIFDIHTTIGGSNSCKCKISKYSNKPVCDVELDKITNLETDHDHVVIKSYN